jgi:hypothetical protein
VLRTGQVEHQLQLFLAGVPRDVRAADRVVEDVRAVLEQVVDRPRDVFLVARDGARAHDHGVARPDLHEPVVAVRHAGEPGHRLALRTGRRDAQLVVGHVLEPVLGDEQAGRRVEVAELRGDARVLFHRAADHRDPPAERGGRVEDLLDARDVARERRDDHAALEPVHDVAERIADGLLRRRVPRVLCARRVRHQAQDAVLAVLRERVQLRQLAVDRRVVELEVARCG